MYTDYTGPRATTQTIKHQVEFINSIILKGNAKLIDTAFIKWMQFNLPALSTCPYASEDCKKFCYAKTGFHVFSNCLENKEKNFIASKQPDFIPKMILTIRAAATTKRYKDTLLMLRLHESGDFYSLKYLKDWIDILYTVFKDDINFNCHFYTKSFIYFIQLDDEYTARLNEMMAAGAVVMNCSRDASTTKKQLDRIEIVKSKFYGVNTYYAISEIPAGTPDDSICKCEDCANCRKCSTPAGKTYYCKIHSANADKVKSEA